MPSSQSSSAVVPVGKGEKPGWLLPVSGQGYDSDVDLLVSLKETPSTLDFIEVAERRTEKPGVRPKRSWRRRLKPRNWPRVALPQMAPDEGRA